MQTQETRLEQSPNKAEWSGTGVRIISSFPFEGPNLLPSSSSRIASWPRQELQTLKIVTSKQGSAAQ